MLGLRTQDTFFVDGYLNLVSNTRAARLISIGDHENVLSHNDLADKPTTAWKSILE